jgi:ATP synthase protein I
MKERDKQGPAPLDALSQSIDRLESQADPRPVPDSETGKAMQGGLEMLSGVAVGTIVGWGLDKWLGTSPFLFILCFFLGAAGGFLTVIRMSK